MTKGLLIVLLFLISNIAFADELILYTQPTENYWQVWVYNLAKKTHRQLTTSPYDKKTPVFSPDGKKILYRTSNGQLFVFDLDTGVESQILANVQYCADPQWVAQDKILFTRYRTDVIDDSDIWLADIETEKPEVLVSAPGLQFQPSLSPDGKKLVYVHGQNPKNHHLFLKDLSTDKSTQITQTEGYNFMPAFSPDGEKIVFVSNQTGDNELWLLDISRDSITQLTRHPGIDTDPKWIDNNKIIYSSYVNGKFQINMLDINNLETETLIEKDKDCCNPNPLPSGGGAQRAGVIKR